MSRSSLGAGAVLFIALLFVSPGRAQMGGLIDKAWGVREVDCVGAATPQRKIISCTAMLKRARSEDQPAILSVRADAYEDLGQYENAIQDLDAIIAMHPSDANALNSRCWARAVQGKQLDIALADCNLSLKLRTDDAPTLDSRGFVNFRMGNYSAAITDCDSALKINQKLASSLYVRGLAKLKNGDTAAGNTDIAAANALDPKIADSYAVYGVKP